MSDVVDSRGAGALPDTVTGRRAERAARRTDFDGSGRRELITVPADVRQQIAEKVQARVTYATKIDKQRARDPHIRLSTYDRLLLADGGQRGEDLVTRLQGSEPLSVSDLALSWGLVNDELIQTEGAVGSTYDVSDWQRGWNEGLRNFQRRIGWVPGGPDTGLQGALGRFATRVHGVMTSEPVRRLRREERTTEHGTGTPELTSAYIDARRFRDIPAARAAEEIMDLHRLKVSVETSLNIPDVNPDRWNQPDFRRGEGHAFLDTIADTQDAILRRLSENPDYRVGGRPMTFAELQAQHPVEAERVRHQAVHEGLLHFADGLARDLLMADRSKVDPARIQENIDGIGKKPKPGSPEETVAKRRVESAQRSLETAMTTLETIAGSRADLERASQEARKARITAENDVTVKIPILDGDIAKLDLDIAPLVGSMVARDVQKRTELQAERDRKIAARDALLTTQSQAQAAEKEANRAYKRLDETDASSPTGTARIGSIKYAEREVKKAMKAVNKAEAKLAGEPSDGDKEKRDALKAWLPVASQAHQERVIDTIFTQDEDGDFQHHILGDRTPDRDGQLIGAERLRRLQFGKSGEQERRMESDEAIARGIIRTFRVDVQTEMEYPPGTSRTYAEMLQRIQRRRDRLTAAIAGGVAVDIDKARRNLQRNEQALLGELLPMLQTASNYQVGELVRFLMNRGLQDAANGNPYMEVPGYHAEQRPERQLTAHALAGEGKGTITELTERTRFRGPRFSWDGELDHLKGDFFDDLNIDDETKFNFSVQTTFSGPGGNRGPARCVVGVQVTHDFLASLPDRQPANWPAPFARQFYDRQGYRLLAPRIMTRQQGIFGDRRDGDWVALPLTSLNVPGRTPLQVASDAVANFAEFYEFGLPGGTGNAFDALDRLNGLISPQASETISTAMANTVVYRRSESEDTRAPVSPAERRRIAEDFRPVIFAVPAFIHPVDPTKNKPAFQLVVTSDNLGQFWIRRYEDDGSPVRPEPITGAGLYGKDRGQQQLEAFFDAQTAAFVQARGDVPRQQELQQQIQDIQSGVGAEILRSITRS